MGLALALTGCGARSALDDGRQIGAAPECTSEDSLARHLGGKRDRAFTDLASAGAGHVFVAGYAYDAKLLHDGDVLAKNGKVFVTELDGSGRVVRDHRFGTPGINEHCALWGDFCAPLVAPALGANARGEVAVAAPTQSPVDFGGSSVGGGAALAKLGSGGELAWSASLTASVVWPVRPAVDEAGEVLVAGRFEGSLAFEGALLGHDTPLGASGFVMKIDGAGHLRWGEVIHFSNEWTWPAVASVHVTGDGGVVLTGALYGPHDFGGGMIPATAEAPTGFMVKLDGAGNFVSSWATGDGFPLPSPEHVALDAAGGLVLVGASPDTNLLGVRKLDASGAVAWHYDFQFPGATDGVPAVDAAGNVFVVGPFSEPIDFGLGLLTPGSASELYLLALDPAGHPIASRSLARPRTGKILPGPVVAVDGCDDLWVGGGFAGSLQLDGAQVTSARGKTHQDAFVARVVR